MHKPISALVISGLLVFGIITTGLSLLSVPSAPGIQFHNDFENEVPHVYTRQDLKDHWNGASTSSVDGGNVEIVKDPVASGRNNVMRIFYPAGKYGEGPIWKTPVGKHEELYLSYDVMFDENFEWVYGGKIPGLAGGPKDHSGGNNPDGTTGWMGRMMWREDGKAVTYMYTYDYGYSTGAKDMRWDDGPSRHRQFDRGKWHTVELYYKMNTPGKSNGVHKAWFDGELAVDRTLGYRTTDAIKVDTFVMSTFYGGGSAKWAPQYGHYVYFDNFVVSTTPITHHDEPIDSNDRVRD